MSQIEVILIIPDRLIRDASLSQLMAKESEVVKEIHSLDSDMQTLVYENYNKFISATDTINKMRVDFRETVSGSVLTGLKPFVQRHQRNFL